MKSKFAVLSIDQGTTGSRAILYDPHGRRIASAYQEFRQFFPRPGWVEHDAGEIWQSVLSVIAKSLRFARLPASSIAAIGITNQRETTVLWHRPSGRPLTQAIVWQDRRTADLCERLKARGFEKTVRRKTGLVLDPYFSGTKVAWLLGHHRRLRQKGKKGEILFGTIDSWLLWKLSGGKVHATDLTNASRTLFLNIRNRAWDTELLSMLGVPASMLPEVRESGSFFGRTVSGGPLRAGIPIHAMMGDQQAALYGQSCYRKGEMKNTYGTGCFVVMNAGRTLARVPEGLLATLACDEKGKSVYALEGSIFVAGAALQWLRDGLNFFKKASETDRLARAIPDSGGVVVIPALAGLGAPYWRADVRGAITGLTRGTRREHIVRATLESLAHQTADVVEYMEKGIGRRIREMRVDGGATANRFLMQFQADLLGIPIWVSKRMESTAWGVAKLAGSAAGVWSPRSLEERRESYQRYSPRREQRGRMLSLRRAWKREIHRLLIG